MKITRGFTLLEMVVVIAVLGVVSASLLGVIRYFYRTNAYVFEATASVDGARRGLATALHGLREASYADDGAYPIQSAATSSVIFYSDVDADGGMEKVRIYIIGTTLYKTVTNASGNPPSYTGQTPATTTIAMYVRNGTTTPLFTYYDSVGTQLSTTTADVSQIAFVRAALAIDLNPNRAPEIFTLTGSATLRNLLHQ